MREKFCSPKCWISREYPENPQNSPQVASQSLPILHALFSKSKSTFSLFSGTMWENWEKWKSCHKIFTKNFRQNGRNSRIFVCNCHDNCSLRNNTNSHNLFPNISTISKHCIFFWQYWQWKRVKADWIIKSVFGVAFHPVLI